MQWWRHNVSISLLEKKKLQILKIIVLINRNQSFHLLLSVKIIEFEIPDLLHCQFNMEFNNSVVYERIFEDILAMR